MVGYTHRLIALTILSFAREALMKHTAGESWRNHKIYQRALIMLESLCVSHEGAEHPKYEQRDIPHFRSNEKRRCRRCTCLNKCSLTIKKIINDWILILALKRKKKIKILNILLRRNLHKIKENLWTILRLLWIISVSFNRYIVFVKFIFVSSLFRAVIVKAWSNVVEIQRDWIVIRFPSPHD